MTTPTVNETDTTNMPGVYELLLDEDTTLAGGNDSEEFCLHITHAGMAPVTRVVEIYRPETTEGNTAAVSATGLVSADTQEISGDKTAADNLEADYDGTGYNKSNSTIGTCTVNTDMRGTELAFLAASAPTNFSSLAINLGGQVEANVEQWNSTNVTSELDLGLGFTFPAVCFAKITAANDTTVQNIDDDYNGTGYDKSNSTIGTALSR